MYVCVCVCARVCACVCVNLTTSRTWSLNVNLCFNAQKVNISTLSPSDINFHPDNQFPLNRTLWVDDDYITNRDYNDRWMTNIQCNPAFKYTVEYRIVYVKNTSKRWLYMCKNKYLNKKNILSTFLLLITATFGKTQAPWSSWIFQRSLCIKTSQLVRFQTPHSKQK